ncbi:MAG: MFS transporter [Promethearchaeota archaeon]
MGRRQSGQIARIYAPGFVGNLHFTAAITVPFFTEWGGLQFTQIFLLQSLFWFSIFLLELPTGLVADRFGRKAFVCGGYAVCAVAVLIYGSVPSFPVFAMAEVVWGFGITLFSGALDALVYDSLKEEGRPEEAAKVFATSCGLWGLSFGIGGLIGVEMVKASDWNVPMMARAIPFTLGAIILLTAREPRMADAGDAGEPPAGKKSIKALARDFVEVVRASRGFRRWLLATVPFEFVGFYTLWIYAPKFTQVGLSYEYWGVVVFVTYLLVVALGKPVKRLSGTRHRRLLSLAGVSLASVVYFALALASSPALAVPLFVALATCRFAWSSIFAQFLNEEVPSGQRATVLSFVSTIVSFSTAVTNLFIGALFDAGVGLVLFSFGVLLAFSLPLVARVPGKRREKEPLRANPV